VYSVVRGSRGKARHGKGRKGIKKKLNNILFSLLLLAPIIIIEIQGVLLRFP
jgi:hypothetical protein